MGTDDRLRASDRDRDSVVEVLREQYGQGRLTIEEFEERSAAALAARTMGDLAPLTVDLPVATAPVVAPSSRPPLWMFVAGALALLFVVGLLLGIAELAGPACIVVFILIARGKRNRGGRYNQGYYQRGRGPFGNGGADLPFNGAGSRKKDGGGHGPQWRG